MRHCSDARYVWNLAVEQSNIRTSRRSGPGFSEHCRQLTEARAAFSWLAEGSQTVQQQALRDYDAAKREYHRGTRGRPNWRKAGRDEGFRIVGRHARKVERVSKHRGRVWIPKAGWVTLRWSRNVPDAQSYRVTRDRAGRWHIAFAAIPRPVRPPGNASVVGVDRGVNVAVATSVGDLLRIPGLRAGEQEQLDRLRRRLSTATKGSRRRERVRRQIASLTKREADRRKDWIEKVSTTLARDFDVIGIEALNIEAMTASARGTARAPGRGVRAKAALNRGILKSGWGMPTRRLEQKAPGRIVKVNPALTSLRCNACSHVDRNSRESQALFRCTRCGHIAHADVNAACNIADLAAGRAVTARGGGPCGQPTNREPQLERTS